MTTATYTLNHPTARVSNRTTRTVDHVTVRRGSTEADETEDGGTVKNGDTEDGADRLGESDDDDFETVGEGLAEE